MVGGFSGVQTGTPAGTTVYIIQTSLTPTPQGLKLGLFGLMKIDTWTFVFAYNVTFTLTPSNGVNTSSVLTASAPNPGTLALSWFGPKPSNGDGDRRVHLTDRGEHAAVDGRRQGDTDRERRGRARATT